MQNIPPNSAIMTNMMNSCCRSSGLVNKSVSLRPHIILELDSKMVSWPYFPFGYSCDTKTIYLPNCNKVVTFLLKLFLLILSSVSWRVEKLHIQDALFLGSISDFLSSLEF